MNKLKGTALMLSAMTLSFVLALGMVCAIINMWGL
jgi:hypothetical protein